MRTVILRTNSCAPDPRVEKEANSLLRRRNQRLMVVCWDRDGRRGVFKEQLQLSRGSIPILRFGIPSCWGGGMGPNLIPMVQFEWQLFVWLLRNHRQYDAVHACDLLTGLPALIPCKIFRKKMVYDIFDFYAATQSGPRPLLKLFEILEKWIIGSADATIICSEERRKQIAGSRPKKLEILHNAPPFTGIPSRPPAREQGSPLRLVYVGNLVPERKLDLILSCAGKMPQTEFHIGGFGILADKIEACAKVHDNIFFYGRRNYSQVLELENQCDAMLALYDPKIPNHRYAAPNKFYEAICLGKPLIMLKNTGMSSLVEQMNLGLTCEASESSLCEAIRKIESNREYWNNQADRMRDLFLKEYCWEIMEKRLIDLYNTL